MKYFTLKECISSNTAKEKGKNEGKPLVFTFFVRSSQTACGKKITLYLSGYTIKDYGHEK